MTLAAIRSFIPATAAVLAIVGFTWLGLWQLDRAGEKERRHGTFTARTGDAPIRLNQRLSVTPSEIDPEWWRYRRVEVSGEVIGDRQYLLDNRTRNAVAGYHVYLPMRLTRSRSRGARQPRVGGGRSEPRASSGRLAGFHGPGGLGDRRTTRGIRPSSATTATPGPPGRRSCSGSISTRRPGISSTPCFRSWS